MSLHHRTRRLLPSPPLPCYLLAALDFCESPAQGIGNDQPSEQREDTIRPARDEEALEISRCAYPMYRKHHLASRLTVALLEQAKQLGLKNVFTRVVTGHPASQKSTGKKGFFDCCLYLALLLSNVDLRQLGGALKTKMSGMMQWKAMSSPRPRAIDLPPLYRDIIGALYDQTGLEIIGPANPAKENIPKLRVQKIPVLSVGQLDVESNGSQPQMVADWIAGQCRRLCSEKRDVIYLNINLEEQGAALIVEQASQLGFIFSGITPDAFVNHDAIVLQYLNLPGDPFVGIVVNSQSGKRLRDVVHQEWPLKAGATHV